MTWTLELRPAENATALWLCRREDPAKQHARITVYIIGSEPFAGPVDAERFVHAMSRRRGEWILCHLGAKHSSGMLRGVSSPSEAELQQIRQQIADAGGYGLWWPETCAIIRTWVTRTMRLSHEICIAFFQDRLDRRPHAWSDADLLEIVTHRKGFGIETDIWIVGERTAAAPFWTHASLRTGSLDTFLEYLGADAEVPGGQGAPQAVSVLLPKHKISALAEGWSMAFDEDGILLERDTPVPPSTNLRLCLLSQAREVLKIEGLQVKPAV